MKPTPARSPLALSSSARPPILPPILPSILPSLLLALAPAALAACHSSPRPSPTPRSEVGKLDEECRLGDLTSCLAAGFQYQSGNEQTHVPIDWAITAAYFDLACAGDMPEGCLLLSQLYQTGGPNQPVDLDKANVALQRMCALGHQDYCGRVARDWNLEPFPPAPEREASPAQPPRQ